VTGRLFDSLGIAGSIHRARHSYATTLLRAGANVRVVQTLMRHSSLATTAAHCAVDEDERAAAIRLLA
jgi:site-specific recombinase XerD